MSRVRDYREVVRRLKSLSARQWRMKRVGEFWGYPFFTLERSISPRVPTVLLSGGMHGEEPGGVEGVLQWLESGAWQRYRVNWLVLPCINPYGWERDQRTNAQRRDINRHFRDARLCPEAQLVKRLVGDRQFLFSMEFHEDWEATGYYLYELRHNAPYVGEKIVQSVGRVIPVSRARVIDGYRVTKCGLIRRDATAAAFGQRRRWPMAFWLYLNCTGHVLGSETPHTVPLAQRAAAHSVALATALRMRA